MKPPLRGESGKGGQAPFLPFPPLTPLFLPRRGASAPSLARKQTPHAANFQSIAQCFTQSFAQGFALKFCPSGAVGGSPLPPAPRKPPFLPRVSVGSRAFNYSQAPFFFFENDPAFVNASAGLPPCGLPAWLSLRSMPMQCSPSRRLPCVPLSSFLPPKTNQKTAHGNDP